MKIQYLGNSGFYLERENRALAVDCYNPQAHPWLKERLAQAREALVLASHRHGDHYHPSMCRIAKDAGAAVLLSDDIVAPCPGALRIKAGEELSVAGWNVRAFGSTDEGVSFLIRWGELTVFHAGDLNNWHWQQESTREEVDEAQAAFLSILKDIVHCAQSIDLAFFPVAPRMGRDCGRGAVQFVQALKPKVFIPMHFGRSLAAVEDCLVELARHTRVVRLGTVGDEADL